MNSALLGMIPNTGFPEILIIALWNLLPTFLYYQFSKGIPGRGIWIPVILIFGWIGYLAAAIFGPKPVSK